MGKNEIKLRRQMLTPGDIGRYRDYAGLLKRHKHDKKKKRYVRIFTYSILVTLVVLLFLIIISFLMVRFEKKREQGGGKGVQSAAVVNSNR